MKEIWKGSALLAPVPLAMVSCGDGQKNNIITVAWCGITCSSPPKTYISLKPQRYSYDIIKNSGSFVINLTPRALVPAADTCGVKSGRDVDKFALTGLTAEPSPNLRCPMIAESPLSIECRVTEILKQGSHDMFLADILSVNAEKAFIDKDGRLRLDKADIVAFTHGHYYALGSCLGSFGFSVMKKKTAARKRTHR